MDDEKTTQKTEDIEGKPQGRVFSQAENDRLVGQAIVREREKYADYNDVKTQLDSLLAEKKEKEMANKSEVEKLQALLSETTTELTNVRGELTTYQKKTLRSDVLNGNKYIGLPRAYKNLVKLSDNMEEIQASADEVLAEYEKDTGRKVAATFGIPEQPDTELEIPKKEVENPAGLAASLRSQIMSKIKNTNRG
jgi:hypothetical protein